MKFLRLLNAVLLKIAGWAVMFSMASIAIIIPYEVFGRYILGNMSSWTSEYSQYALVWASMLGGAVGLKRGYQVGITSLTDALPPGPSKVVQAMSSICVIIFLSLTSWYGVEQMMMNRFQVSSTMGIPMSIPYAALPVGFFVMLLVSIEQFVDLLSGAGKETEAPADMQGA